MTVDEEMTADWIIKYVESTIGENFARPSVLVLIEEIKRLRNARVLGMEEAVKITERYIRCDRSAACGTCLILQCVVEAIREAAKNG